MSLIVAQTTPKGPVIVSDTRVTSIGGKPSAPKNGTLKVVVIDEHTAVCFAGKVEDSLDAIRHYSGAVSGGVSREEADKILVATTEESDSDFIVASSDASAPLLRIARGGVDPLEVAWIGNKDAFEAFQRARQEYRASPSFDVFKSLPPSAQMMSELGTAMDRVIGHPGIETVGDFCVRVSAGKGFQYLASSFIHVGRDIQVRDGDNLISKMAQPTSEGGYAVTIVAPKKCGVPALGLNFPKARLGIVYLPLRFYEAQVIANVGPREFASAVREKFSIEFEDPMLQ